MPKTAGGRTVVEEGEVEYFGRLGGKKTVGPGAKTGMRK